MNIKEDIKAFNEEQKQLLESLVEKQKKASDAFIKKIALDLRPKFVELEEVISGLTPDLRSAVLADETISKAVKTFLPKKSSGKNKSGSRTSSKQLQTFTKEGKTEAEIMAEFSTVDSARLKKEVTKKKLKLTSGKYFPA
jgi:hypothetical protein